MLAGIDTNVLIDIRILRIEPVAARLLEGEGWTTAFVDREFADPLEETEGGVGRVFPFVDIDPVDARLLPIIQRDQIAIAGRRRAATGDAAGEVSLIHVAQTTRPGSIIVSNDRAAIALGRRYGVSVRGTLYLLHCAFLSDLITAEDSWEHYLTLYNEERRPPILNKLQFESYLETGDDPRK